MSNAPRPVTYRAQTAAMVNQAAMLFNQPRHEVYSRVYKNLFTLYGIDLYKFPRTNGESLLVIAERHDLLDKVYQLAFAESLNYLVAL